MPNQVVFRPDDDDSHERLGKLADENGRTRSDEMRAAVHVYLDIVELSELRAALPETEAERESVAEAERRLKDDIGRVLLAAISRDSRSTFEHAVGVEYPVGRIGRISTPFDRLIDWIVDASE